MAMEHPSQDPPSLWSVPWSWRRPWSWSWSCAGSPVEMIQCASLRVWLRVWLRVGYRAPRRHGLRTVCPWAWWGRSVLPLVSVVVRPRARCVVLVLTVNRPPFVPPVHQSTKYVPRLVVVVIVSVVTRSIHLGRVRTAISFALSFVPFSLVPLRTLRRVTAQPTVIHIPLCLVFRITRGRRQHSPKGALRVLFFDKTAPRGRTLGHRPAAVTDPVPTGIGRQNRSSLSVVVGIVD